MILFPTMMAFILFGTPLFFAALYWWLNDKDRRWRREIIPFYWGLIYAVPAALLFLLPRMLYGLSYDASGIYLYYWLDDFFIPHALGALGFWLFVGVGGESEKAWFLRPLGWYAGIYTVWVLPELLISFGENNLYLLFLLPLTRIAFLLLTASSLALLFKRFSGYRPGLSFLPLVFSFPAALVPLFYYTYYPFLAFLSAFLLTVAGGLLFFLGQRRGKGGSE